MKTLRVFAAAVGLVVASAIAPIASANPSLNLRISDNVGGGWDVDTNSITGVVGFNGAIGNWLVNVVTGLGSPILAAGNVDLNSVNVTSSNGGSLSLVLTQTGTNVGTGAALLGFLNSIGGTLATGAGNSISWSAILDGTTGCSGTYTGANGPGFSANCGFQGFVADASNFTMVLMVDIVHTSGGATSFDNAGKIVPEPGMLLLVGAGLIGLAVVRRRKVSPRA